MQEPDRPHLVTNLEMRMVRSFLIDDPLLVLGELYTSPTHRPPPCGATQRNDLLAELDVDLPQSSRSGNVSFGPVRGIFVFPYQHNFFNLCLVRNRDWLPV